MSIHFGIISMEANKRRIIYSSVIVGIFIFIGVLVIYIDIGKQKSLMLPDSADDIISISVCETSCDGTFCKDISDELGIKAIIDILHQVEIDFSEPKKWELYVGASGRTIVLYDKDGINCEVEMAVLGGDRVIFHPSSDINDPVYYGTWPDSENFFQNLDYPMVHLKGNEIDQYLYKGLDT